MADKPDILFYYDESGPEGCYWIEAEAGPFAYHFDPVRLVVPEDMATTQDIQSIVQALRRIAARQRPEPC